MATTNGPVFTRYSYQLRQEPPQHETIHPATSEYAATPTVNPLIPYDTWPTSLDNNLPMYEVESFSQGVSYLGAASAYSLGVDGTASSYPYWTPDSFAPSVVQQTTLPYEVFQYHGMPDERGVHSLPPGMSLELK
jgi:hypothetical protein